MATLNSISRLDSLMLLRAPFADVARSLARAMSDDMVVYETLRTKERQAKLRAIGASQTKLSAHEYGLALDMVLAPRFVNPWMSSGEKRFRGHPQVEEADHIWKEYGMTARSLGLLWGGDWKMRDLVHVELKDWRRIMNG